MGSQASKGGVAVEGKAAGADPAAAKTNGQVGSSSSVTATLLMETHPHPSRLRSALRIFHCL